MAVKLIEGLHLTANDKRVLQHMRDNGMLHATTPRAGWTLVRLEEGGYAFTITKKERDDWGRRVFRPMAGVVEFV